MAWLMVVHWIVVLLFGTQIADGQTIAFTIKPTYVAINESVTISCYGIPSSPDLDYYEVTSPWDPRPCTFNCYVYDDCKENLSVDADCYCNGQNKTIGDVCEDNTENVTFIIFKANDAIFGDWTCSLAPNGDPVVARVNQFSPSSPPEIQGNRNITENASTTFICNSTGGDPPERYYWYIDDGTQEHNVTTSSNTLTITPDRTWNGHEVICRVLQLEERTPQETRVTISVLFGYTVEIFPCPGEHVALQGTRVELTCDVGEKGNPATENFLWYKEGITDPVSAVQTYVISDSVAENHQGLYSCQCDNGYDGTPSHTKLIVQYHPENVSIAGETVVIEGQQLQLSCSSQAIPEPAYTWTFPNGTSKEINDIVIPITKIEDAGSYECRAVNTIYVCGDSEGGTQGSSTTTDVRVQYYPRGKPETQIDEVIAVNITNMLHCNNSTLDKSGDPYPTWIQWYQNGSLYQNFTAEEGTSWEFVSLSVNDSGRYSCSCSNFIGASDVSDEVQVTVEAPATIEKYTNSTENPIYDDGKNVCDFHLECLVSASNIDSVQILHNGQPILDMNNNFEMESTIENCTGGCRYDLPTAELLQVWWKVENRSLTCADIQSYDGEYVCRGSATTAGASRDVVSEETLIVTTQYSPIWNGESRTIKNNQEEADPVTITCEICSNPPPLGFQWYHDETGIIEGATNQSFTLVPPYGNGEYFCEVYHKISNKTFPVTVSDSVDPDSGLSTGITARIIALALLALLIPLGVKIDPVGGLSGGIIALIIILVLLALLIPLFVIMFIRRDDIKRKISRTSGGNKSAATELVPYEDNDYGISEYASAETLETTIDSSTDVNEATSGNEDDVYAQVDRSSKKNRKGKNVASAVIEADVYAQVDKKAKKNGKKQDDATGKEEKYEEDSIPASSTTAVYAEASTGAQTAKATANVTVTINNQTIIGTDINAQVNKDSSDQEPVEYAQVNIGLKNKKVVSGNRNVQHADTMIYQNVEKKEMAARDDTSLYQNVTQLGLGAKPKTSAKPKPMPTKPVRKPKPKVPPRKYLSNQHESDHKDQEQDQNEDQGDDYEKPEPNEDGLVYTTAYFGDRKPSEKIHGEEDATVYADIQQVRMADLV